MRPRVNWPPHTWIWGAGIVMCLLGASGVAVIVRTTTPAYAGNTSYESSSGDPSSAIASSPLHIAKAGASRASCTECGTIASVREVASAADAARREQGDARRDHGAAISASTHPIAAGDAEAPMYEVTIRFRDGRTSVFTEPGPPTWRVGSRIVFIEGTTPKAD